MNESVLARACHKERQLQVSPWVAMLHAIGAWTDMAPVI